MTRSILNYLPMAPPPNSIILGIRASAYKHGSGRHKHFIHNNVFMNMFSMGEKSW